jgi:hypothetical protein
MSSSIYTRYLREKVELDSSFSTLIPTGPAVGYFRTSGKYIRCGTVVKYQT